MDKDLAITLVQVAAPVVLAAIGWLIRSYLRALEKEMQALSLSVGKDIARVEGQISALSADLRRNTIETAKTAAEVAVLLRIRDEGHDIFSNDPS